MTDDQEIALRVAISLLKTTGQPAMADDLIELRSNLLLSRSAAGASEVQEPVAEVISTRERYDFSNIDKALPLGTKLYTHPSAALSTPASKELKPLSESEIEAGWKHVFSTENPYNPVSLKSFTKAVRWAERSKESK